MKERNIEGEKPIEKSLQSVIDNCLKKLSNLKREFLSVQNSDYLIFTEEEFIEQKKIILAEKQEAEKSLNQLSTGGEDTQIKVQNFFTFCLNAIKLFKTNDLYIQRIILKTIGSNLSIFNKKLLLDKHYPFVHIENINKSKIDYSEQFEPENTLELQEYFPIYRTLCSIQLNEIEAIRIWIHDNPSFDIPNSNMLENLNHH